MPSFHSGDGPWRWVSLKNSSKGHVLIQKKGSLQGGTNQSQIKESMLFICMEAALSHINMGACDFYLLIFLSCGIT